MVASVGYKPKIPLISNEIAGPYALTETFNENARQNVKMIVLTDQGEKLTDVDFGCGLRRYLFEQRSTFAEEEVREEIIEQIERYAPYIEVTSVDIEIPDDHIVRVAINYTIVPTFEVTI